MAGQKKTSTLLLLCLTTGTLDAFAAIIMSWPHTAVMFKYIASGWVGVAAFKDGTGMVVLGILSHYLIASIHSCVFFFLYPGFKRVIGNKIAIAVIMGVLIWAIMEFLVLPLSNIPKRSSPESISSMLEGAGVLCVTLGGAHCDFCREVLSEQALMHWRLNHPDLAKSLVVPSLRCAQRGHLIFFLNSLNPLYSLL